MTPERLQDVTLAERLRALHARLDAKLGAGFIDDIPGDELSAIREAAAALSVRGWPKGVLNRKATLELLSSHNAWRRGAEGPQTDPRMLGLALDAAVAYIATPPSEG